ncbi:MAG: cytochrome c [Desulfuromonadales bacterium]|nr:cytochrome c [Desulfuromonadales bacterium]
MTTKVAAAAATVLLFACTALVQAAEVTYRNDIQPIFQARCAACHGSDAPEYPAFKEAKDQWLAKETGPRMDTYTHLISYTAWPDTGALMRRLDAGKPGNMYQYLGDDEAERQKNLALFKAWVGNWSLKRWAEISKEEIEGIKVRY